MAMVEKGNSTRKSPFVVAMVIFFSWLLRYYTSSSMPPINSHPTTKDFDVRNARRYLENITALGPRITGTENLELKATRVLVNALRQIKSEAPGHVTIDIDIQHPSSFFFLDFLGGMINVYTNITNVVVKLEWDSSSYKHPHAVLINSHYDSISGSAGASDDAVGAACMLETIRVLAHGPILGQPIIFLFNGAEESLMQGSHGFITQHKWAANIRYIINLEAMGAGGREMVFQCNSEWMASFYAKHAAHPNANVLANELFSNLLWRTAATDFRTILSHGPTGMVGVDSAYTLNGYVYHTSFDTIDAVPDATLQHTGDNLLSLAIALSRNKEFPPQSPSNNKSLKNSYFPNPVTPVSAIYFDLFAWNIVYTGYFTISILHSMIFFVGLYTSYHLYLSAPQQDKFLWHLFISLWNEIYCLILSLLVNLLISLCLHCFAPMLWYDSGLFTALLIYVPPTLITSAFIKSKYHHLYSQKYGLSNTLSMWLLFLGLCIFFNLMLGYVACLHILSISGVLAAGTLISNYMTQRAPILGYDRSKLIQAAVLYSYEILQLPILYIWWSVFSPTFTMLIPLMGKVGTVIPSDSLISLVIAIGVSTGWSTLFPFVIRSGASYKNLCVGYIIFILSLVTILRPYSDLHPKRLWIQHVYKEHYPQVSSDGSKSPFVDHGLWVSAFDATGMDPIISYVKTPFHRNLLSPRLANIASVLAHPLSQYEFSCDGWSGDCYFKYPYSYPVAEALQDFIFIPLEVPPDSTASPSALRLDISIRTTDPVPPSKIPSELYHLRSLPSESIYRRIIDISLTGSSHMTLVIRELSGSHLLRWFFSQEGDKVPNPENWHDSSVVNRPDGVYYIQIGFGMCPQNVCQQRVHLEVYDEVKDSKLQIAAYSHYMEGPDEPIRQFIDALPSWSTGAEWSQYQSSMIVKYA